jgi:hypothetical protein
VEDEFLCFFALGVTTSLRYQVGTVVCVHAKRHEGTLVFGCQHFVGHCQAIDENLWKTLGH